MQSYEFHRQTRPSLVSLIGQGKYSILSDSNRFFCTPETEQVISRIDRALLISALESGDFEAAKSICFENREGTFHWQLVETTAMLAPKAARMILEDALPPVLSCMRDLRDVASVLRSFDVISPLLRLGPDKAADKQHFFQTVLVDQSNTPVFFAEAEAERWLVGRRSYESRASIWARTLGPHNKMSYLMGVDAAFTLIENAEADISPARAFLESASGVSQFEGYTAFLTGVSDVFDLTQKQPHSEMLRSLLWSIDNKYFKEQKPKGMPVELEDFGENPLEDALEEITNANWKDEMTKQWCLSLCHRFLGQYDREISALEGALSAARIVLEADLEFSSRNLVERVVCHAYELLGREYEPLSLFSDLPHRFWSDGRAEDIVSMSRIAPLSHPPDFLTEYASKIPHEARGLFFSGLAEHYVECTFPPLRPKRWMAEWLVE